MAIRREPVPAAYRVFFRHIGLDPDVVRTPIEAAVLERMLRGGFLSGGLLADVLLIALVDTGVPCGRWTRSRVDGPLGIRASREGERLGRARDAPPLPAGRLVVADASARAGDACSASSPRRTRRGPPTRALTLFAVQVAGVPELYRRRGAVGVPARARALLSEPPAGGSAPRCALVESGSAVCREGGGRDSSTSSSHRS